MKNYASIVLIMISLNNAIAVVHKYIARSV